MNTHYLDLATAFLPTSTSFDASFPKNRPKHPKNNKQPNIIPISQSTKNNIDIPAPPLPPKKNCPLGP